MTSKPLQILKYRNSEGRELVVTSYTLQQDNIVSFCCRMEGQYETDGPLEPIVDELFAEPGVFFQFTATIIAYVEMVLGLAPHEEINFD